MKKLLITGAWKYTQQQYNALSNMGYDICFVQNEKDVLPNEAFDAEVIICNGLFLYHSIEKFTKLKKIQLTSAGFDRVPVDYIKKHNIDIYNARGVYSIPMAEFALCGVLQLYKQSRFFNSNQKKSEWVKNRELIELNGKAVAIVGCGSVGTACAKRFKAFDTTVLAVDILEPESKYYDEYYHIENIKDALSKSDIIVLTIPLTDDTRHLFDSKIFGCIKKETVLVNISRGAIINEKDLISALQNGILYGAVLDVFETEPLDSKSVLWNMENVIITPHNSFVGDGNNKRLGDIILKNMEI